MALLPCAVERDLRIHERDEDRLESLSEWHEDILEPVVSAVQGFDPAADYHAAKRQIEAVKEAAKKLISTLEEALNEGEL